MQCASIKRRIFMNAGMKFLKLAGRAAASIIIWAAGKLERRK